MTAETPEPEFLFRLTHQLIHKVQADLPEPEPVIVPCPYCGRLEPHAIAYGGDILCLGDELAGPVAP